jgi:predicted Ser/Thr protein kinase
MNDDRPPRSIEGTVPLTPPGQPGRPGSKDRVLGQVLDGRYRMRTVLGEGGMGTVYLCDDEKLNRRRVAVKLMSPLLTTDPEFRARFQREAVLQANLPHPQIVQVIDVGESAEGSYIAMEYSDGRSLATLIRELGPRPLDRALDIAEQILEVLDFAHRQGVVHRDLKPSNILIEDRAGREYVRILDFGIAKLVAGDGSAEPGLTLTKSGHAYGTLGYMAPEQARGESESIDHRTDLYSVGVILHEMLTGRVPSPPEARTHPVRYAMWVAANPIRPIRETHPELGIPQEVDNIILGALRRDPVKRHPSALAFLNAIREFRRNAQAPTVRAPAKAERRTPPPGDTREPLAVARPATILPWMLAALALVGGGAGWWMHLRGDSRAGGTTDPELARKLAAAEEQVRDRERALTTEREAGAALAQELAGVKTSQAEAEGLQRRLAADLEEARRQLGQAQAELVKLQGEGEGSLGDWKARAERAGTELSALDARVRELEASEGALRGRLERAEADLRQGGEAGTRIVELEGQVQSLSQALQAAQKLGARSEAEAEQARQAAETARGDLAALQGQLESKDAEIRSLRSTGGAETIRGLQAEIARLQTRVTEEESRARSASAEVARLQQILNRSGLGPTPEPPVVTATSITIENGFPDNLEIAELEVFPADGSPSYRIESSMAQKDISVSQSGTWTLRGPPRQVVVRYRKWDRGNRRYFRELLEVTVPGQMLGGPVRIGPDR